MKRVTINDLARMLSVSASTVSRALADHPDISEPTRQRVRELAQTVGYVPNFRARYLRAQHSRIVALIVPNLNMFFVPSLIDGINVVLEKHDYSLVVFQSHDQVVHERKLAQLCLNLSIDGVLLARASDATDLVHIDRLREADIPVVLVDKTLDTRLHATVTVDDRQLGIDAARYLLERGHTDVLGIFGDARLLITSLRLDGFRQGWQAQGHTLPDASILTLALLPEFDAQFDALLDANSGATAVFAMSDELLVRSHYRMMLRGLRIPEDLSLVGVSDGNAPYFLFPNVTHLLTSGSEMGEKAAHVLLSMLQHFSDASIDVRVRTPMVELDSVRPLKREV